MAGVKLYELSAARDILDQFLSEAEGEETPEIADLFAQLNGEIERKVEDTALWIKEKEAEAAALKQEEQRLAARRRALENRAERTKHYLELQLEQLGRDKVHGLIVDVALQTNPPSVKGDVDADALWDVHEGDTIGVWRDILRFVPETVTLDRRAALERHKAGRPLPDGLTVERTRSLRIR